MKIRITLMEEMLGTKAANIPSTAKAWPCKANRSNGMPEQGNAKKWQREAGS